MILDISSDDETGLSEPQGGGGDDFDWISEFLNGADDKEPGDDSDEVFVVDITNTIRKSNSSKSTVGDTDDDCLVLEGDPNNTLAVVDDAVGGSDELHIVGEKGQVTGCLETSWDCKKK